MASAHTLIRPLPDEMPTDRFDPVGFVDDRHHHRSGDLEPGRYLQIEGPKETLLIALGNEVMHIGRGIAADVHLDHSSVSRRHSILLARSAGVRILDDRSYNGTFVNGRRVEQADLRNGDLIMLGDIMLTYLEL